MSKLEQIERENCVWGGYNGLIESFGGFMKKLLFVLFLMGILVLSACGGGDDEGPVVENLVVASPTPKPTSTPFPVVVESDGSGGSEGDTEEGGAESAVATVTPFPSVLPEGLVLDVPETLASSIAVVNFEEAIVTDPDAPQWLNKPAYEQHNLTGYPVENNLYGAAVEIYPVQGLVGANAQAAQEIDLLLSLLAERPNLTDGSVESLPFLPLINAAQVFYGQAEYISFQNGTGIRYLTQYSQQITTINNGEIFYTFQGISDDRSTFVSAILPVRSDLLPDAPPQTGEEWEAIAADIDRVMGEGLNLVNGAADDQFMPSLASLDRLIGTMSAQVAEPEVEITEEGIVPLSLFYPSPNGQVRTGRPMRVEGFTNPGGVTTLRVSLRVGANELASETFFSEENGSWAGELPVPYSVEGWATLTVNKANEEISSRVLLVRDPEEVVSGAAVDMTRPSDGHTAVSGYTMFYEGRVTNPISDTVSIGILIDNCTTFVARYSFTVASPGGSWNGSVVLPRDLRGEACAVAYTGEYGQSEWREVQTPILITDESDEAAPRLDVASLFRQNYAQGETVYIYGAAVGTDQVTVKFILDGETEIANVPVPVGSFGFWEVNVPLPAEDAAGFVLMEVTIPEDDETLYTAGFEVE